MTERERFEREKKLLKIVFSGVLLFPLGLGAVTMWGGMAGAWLAFGLTGEPLDNPTMDSNLRFLGANFFGMGILLAWGIRKIETRSIAIQIFTAVAVLGATARIISHLVVGAPNLMAQSLIAVELSVVALFLWQRRIAAWHQRLA